MEYLAFDPCVLWEKGGNAHKVTHFLEFDMVGNVHTNRWIWRLVVRYGDSANIEFLVRGFLGLRREDTKLLA